MFQTGRLLPVDVDDSDDILMIDNNLQYLDYLFDYSGLVPAAPHICASTMCGNCIRPRLKSAARFLSVGHDYLLRPIPVMEGLRIAAFEAIQRSPWIEDASVSQRLPCCF